jgi:hypothetical protein
MWPFRRRKPPRVESVSLGYPSTNADDFTVLTVGQSRLGDSFTAIGFTADSEPRFTQASVVPLVDPRMGVVADVEVRVDGYVVGYLRPPSLNRAIEQMELQGAETLEIPVMIFFAPAGPEVRVHSALA